MIIPFRSFLEAFDQIMTGSPQSTPAQPYRTLPTTSLCCNELSAWSTSAWALHLCPVKFCRAFYCVDQQMVLLVPKVERLQEKMERMLAEESCIGAVRKA